MQNVSQNTLNDLKFIFSSFQSAPNFTIHCEDKKPEVFIHQEASVGTGSLKKTEVQCQTLADCDKLLRNLISNKDLVSFSQPVLDSEAPGYKDVIKEPMDLSTMQRRLKTGSINSVAEFKRCLDLIWSNCNIYNGPAHPLTKIAFDYRNEIDRQWNEMKPLHEIDLNKLKEIKEKLDKAEQVFSKVFAIPRREPLPPPPKPEVLQQKVVETKVRETVPTTAELFKIQTKLANTPPEDMKAAWDILVPFLKDNADIEKKSFNLKDLPDNLKIDLKKAVLK